MFFILTAALFMMSILLLMMSVFLMIKVEKDFEKLSPFECGFNLPEQGFPHFSLSFFLLALLFLIFDIELILLFPILLSSILLANGLHFLMFIIFLFILTSTLYWEWKNGILEWLL